MGPLTGIRIVEFEGLGPGPLAGLFLAQLGADVTVVQRPRPGAVASRLGGASVHADILLAGKRLVPVDLKQPAGVQQALALLDGADALIEGNRPGVMERLGLGPQVCLERNPRLVYGRMTGWGQTGPLAHSAGHDLNYVALTGLLSLAGAPGALPRVPPTVIGDAGGALGLAFGIVSAVLQAGRTGQGQVVDAAIVDIVAGLGTLVHWAKGAGQIDGAQPSPFHDSPFYDVYACADGGCITIAALEPQFYALLLAKLGLDDIDPQAQYDTAQWPVLKARLTALFASRSREAWCALLEGSDVCFAPVLSLDEAAQHPHLSARGTLRRNPAGTLVAAAAPRFCAPPEAG
jgi:alpha-methylacyl-CoA racemase